MPYDVCVVFSCHVRVSARATLCLQHESWVSCPVCILWRWDTRKACTTCSGREWCSPARARWALEEGIAVRSNERAPSVMDPQPAALPGALCIPDVGDYWEGDE